MKFDTYVELHLFSQWKYINDIHVFLFFIITDKIRCIGAFILSWYCCRNIQHIPEQEMAQFSYVVYCFLNFLCTSLFLQHIYFIVFIWNCLSIEYQWITVILTVMKANNAFYSSKWILGLKCHFVMCFVHKSRKFSNFEPTFDCIMLRYFRVVCLTFTKIVSKVAQDFKEKKPWKLAVRKKKKSLKIIVWNIEGGIPPPPCLFRVKLLVL